MVDIIVGQTKLLLGLSCEDIRILDVGRHFLGSVSLKHNVWFAPHMIIGILYFVSYSYVQLRLTELALLP